MSFLKINKREILGYLKINEGMNKYFCNIPIQIRDIKVQVDMIVTNLLEYNILLEMNG
jgi:hypothetical protein